MDTTRTVEQIEAALAARDLSTASSLIATLPHVAFPRPGSIESVRRRLVSALGALADSLTETSVRCVYFDQTTGRTWRSVAAPAGRYDELYEEVI